MFNWSKEKKRIRAYGEVGYPGEGFTHQDFMEALDDIGGDDITIELQSVGGDVYSGLSIKNQIADYPGHVTVKIDAMAASIASVFPLAADRIIAAPGSTLMVHNPWTIVMGDAGELREVADVLDKLGGSIAEIYAERTGRKKDFWIKRMAATTYYNVEEALADGLIDEIAGGAKVAASIPVDAARPRMAALSATLAKVRHLDRIHRNA